MIIASVTFVQPVPVLGTSQRLDEFTTAAGWTIDEQPNGIVLHRKAVPEQNVREVPSFRVANVGYCVEVSRVATLPPPAGLLAGAAGAAVSGTINEATIGNQSLSAEALLQRGHRGKKR